MFKTSAKIAEQKKQSRQGKHVSTNANSEKLKKLSLTYSFDVETSL